MDETLKWTVREARDLAHAALVALEELDDLMIEVEDEEAEHVCDEVREALRAVAGMKAAVDAWRMDVGQVLPEQGELELPQDHKA